MRPPMVKLADGVLTLQRPHLDENGNPLTDDYGKPIMDDVPVEKARIERSTKYIQGSDGQQHKCILEVDLPPEITIAEGDGARFHPPELPSMTGTIISVIDTINLAGNRVYFRTVYIE